MNNSLSLMRARLNVHGGVAQQDRMIKDKKETLEKVSLYSYQGATVRKVGSESIERALINPNSVKQDYDDKIISIDYKHEYKPGTVFEWVNTGTKWLIYLQDLTELAYFRGNIRKCSYEIKWLNKDNEICSTVAAIRGPKETGIEAQEDNNISFDYPNHSLELLIPATNETLEYFVRYNKFYLQSTKDNPICWRIEAIDTISMPGILQISAIEYYSNKQKDNVEEGLVNTWVEEIPQPQDATIEGEIFIKPKISYTYKYLGQQNSDWVYDTRLPIEAKINDKEITIVWKTTYTGEFVLRYGDSEKTIIVESLF